MPDPESAADMLARLLDFATLAAESGYAVKLDPGSSSLVVGGPGGYTVKAGRDTFIVGRHSDGRTTALDFDELPAWFDRVKGPLAKAPTAPDGPAP